MKKFYVKPIVEVVILAMEHAILGLSLDEKRSSYLDIPFAVYEMESVPTEADSNFHQFNPWEDEEEL